MINPTISLKGQKKFYVKATPQWFIGWTIDGYDPFDISASFVRLNKFGLIELMLDRTAGTDKYEALESDDYLLGILKKYQERNPDVEIEIGSMQSILYVNEYGSQFKNACR